MSGWIGVDLDRTLAKYDFWRGENHIGPPIPEMLERVQQWVQDGKTVKIFTARYSDPETRDGVRAAIHAWLAEHNLPPLEVTCTKDYACTEIWDDIAVQVIPNTGIRADGKM